MRWANFFHIYQPPRWPTRIIRKVSRESYRPLVRFLLGHRQVRVTLNISGSLTEQLASLPDQRDILVGVRTLLGRKQIELTDSAMYHAILPLLPTAEIVRQIKLNRATNRKHLGPAYRPTGFFPPEMAYSPALARVLTSLGYTWVIIDGISHPGLVDYTVRSRIRGTRLSAIFRNRFMSDYLAFEAQLRDRGRFLETARRWDGQSSLLVTAMDGENLGHHRHEAKRLWQSLVRLNGLSTITISDLLALQAPDVDLRPRSASWSTRQSDIARNAPFSLWRDPNNALHQLQWRLFTTVMTHVGHVERRRQLPAAIRREVDQAVASDWYWWASREPWWDVDIVVNAATRLQVLGNELGLSRAEDERVQGLVRDIISTAHRWQSNGAAQRHAGRFLSGSSTPHYLGGTKVHYPLSRKTSS